MKQWLMTEIEDGIEHRTDIDPRRMRVLTRMMVLRALLVNDVERAKCDSVLEELFYDLKPAGEG